MNGAPVGENASAGAASIVAQPGRPIITYAVIGLCLLNFFWASVDQVGMYLHLVEPIYHLPSGWWALFSTALVHIEISHLVFNLLAFLALGQIVELTAGKIRFLILLVLVAWMASFSQLFFERAFGIGLSGVVYGIFGFMLGAAPANRYYLWFVRKNAAMLIGWAILCVILTQFKVLKIANAAHFGGLIFGILCGLYYGLPRLRWLVAALVLTILTASVAILPTLKLHLTMGAVLPPIVSAVGSIRRVGLVWTVIDWIGYAVRISVLAMS
jgi:membrane associated rhomboid family serine protease